jgi:hypothetical protein
MEEYKLECEKYSIDPNTILSNYFGSSHCSITDCERCDIGFSKDIKDITPMCDSRFRYYFSDRLKEYNLNV